MKGQIPCVLDDCCGEVIIELHPGAKAVCNECLAVYELTGLNTIKVTPVTFQTTAPIQILNPDAHEDASDRDVKCGKAVQS